MLNSKLCCVCQILNSKYKCPSCKDYYCSVSCCKQHKDICSGEAAIIQKEEDTGNESCKQPNEDYEFPTEDTVPINKLKELRNSDDVRNCLSNPHVRTIINSILKDKNPTEAIAKAMTEPIFVELADACLKVVEPQEDIN